MSDPHSVPSDRPEVEARTIASTLRAARQEQGRTLSQAATALQLAVPDLAELERQDDASVVADVRTMARLRVYGRYLSLDPERMLTTALQPTGNEPQGESAGQAPAAAPPNTASGGSTLPPPPDGESRGKRVSAVALLVTLGLVAAVGTAAAAVVFSSQPDQQVQLTSPASQQTEEASEGEEQTQSLASDDENADDGEDAGDDENAGDDEGSSGEERESADEGAGSEDGAASDPADSSPQDTGPEPTDTDPEPPTGPGGESESSAGDSSSEAEHEDLPGRAPEETSVQVLDGAGDTENRDAVVEALEGHGYVVAAVNAASNPHEQSTVFYSPGWKDEAEALAAREDGFVVSEDNPGFSEDVGLHVVVGTDWSS